MNVIPVRLRTASSDGMKGTTDEALCVCVCVCVFQIGVAFYEMLQAVDQHCQHLSYMDPICDFLYHIKYMYTGDSVKEQVSPGAVGAVGGPGLNVSVSLVQVEKIIMTLRPAMKLRLRFITHSSMIESSSSSSAIGPAPQAPPSSASSLAAAASPSSSQHTHAAM